MKTVFVLSVILLGMYSAAAVTHSWKAFYTGSTGLDEFPEFVALNLLDDEVMGYFDSRTNVFESKQSWMMENLGQEYVDEETNVLRGYPPSFKANIQIARQRFNQTTGVHIFQYMYGCDWDDETGAVHGFAQIGYDGEDFVAWDTQTYTYVAAKQQAQITKNKWNNDRAEIEHRKNYLNEQCPEWLKKYVNYGKTSLMRTAAPSVSLLQSSPSSPISCFATGFYPNRADMFWRRDGEEIHADVDKGEILPNHDGTFQMRVDLSSVRVEDRNKYECVFQLSGLKDDVVKKVEEPEIRSNHNKETSTALIVGIVVAILALVLIVVVGYLAYKKKRNGKDKVPLRQTPSPDGSDAAESQELNPSA